MDLTKINKIGRLEEYLPTKKLSELDVFKSYQITGLRKVKTKFGIRIIGDVEGTFTVFLPARMAKVLDEDEDLLQKMTSASEENRLHMKYLGGQYNEIEFDCV